MKLTSYFFLLPSHLIRIILMIFCTALLQVVILLHRPFIQVEFAYSFYSVVALIFSMYLIEYFNQKKIWVKYFYLVDLGALVFLFSQQPGFSSLFLILLLFYVFLLCLEKELTESILIVFLCSVSVSLLNAIEFKWTGTQNLLSLLLFNFSFVVVAYIAMQFRQELLEIRDQLDTTTLKLRSKEELAHVVIENIPFGVFAVRANEDILFTNSNLKEKLFLDSSLAQDLLKKKYDLNVTEVNYFNNQLADKRIYQIDSAEYFDVDLKEKIDIHIIKDVTEIRSLQDQVKQKEKLAAVGQLAAGIAHEIRNPLAGISGSIELLSNDKTDPDDKKLMKIILKEIDRLNNLITEFLDYSKPEKRPDQKVDLSFILDEVLQNIKMNPNLPSKINIQVNLKPALVLGFSDKLKQAFLNILMNALQAMKDTLNPEIKVKINEENEYYRVEISDNGSGMSEETKKRIFEPFFTTKAKGTGLGMAMTYKIFEFHDAQISVESELNKGTIFKILFKK